MSRIKEPTLFKVKLLDDTAYNSFGDILNVKMVDEEGSIYYYDQFHRWCYLLAKEEDIVWKRCKTYKKKAPKPRRIISTYRMVKSDEHTR